MTAPLYDAAQTKQEKTKVIASLVNRIRRESPQGGGFIKRDTITGFWYEIGNDKARDKVGHAIRRAIDAKKKKKRKLSSLVNLVSSSDKGLDAAVNLSALADSSDAKPSSVTSRSKALSMPMKIEPLPALGATNAVASLPQNQPNLLSSASLPSLGQANVGLPLRGSVRMNNALLRNDLAQNANNDAQPVSSSSYIGGSGGRIADIPHLSGLGNLLGGNDGMNSAAMQLRRQSLGQTSDFGSASLNRLLSQTASSLQRQLLGLSGPMTFQDQTMLNPIGAPNESTLQLPDSSDTTFFPADSTAMEQLFSTLKPTPIGSRLADAGTTTDMEDHTGKKTESSSFHDRSSPHTKFDF